MKIESTPSKEERLVGSIHAVCSLSAHSITAQHFFKNFQQPGIPVVLKGIVENTLTWDLNYLCQVLSTQEFPVRYYGQQRYQQDKRQWKTTGSGVETRILPFERYAEMLRSGEADQHDAYLARCALSNTPLLDTPGYRQLEAAEAQLGLKGAATALNLWLGPGGHVSSLHYDPMDGTLSQLYGQKRVILFPPSQTYNLYPIAVWNHLVHGLKRRAVYSQVYPDRPDVESFPRFQIAQQHRYEVILDPGDVLFLPAGWWHEVVSLGTGVVCSTNRFWHVSPMTRALTSWNKWRAHLGSALAAPHIAWNFARAMSTSTRSLGLRDLVQRL